MDGDYKASLRRVFEAAQFLVFVSLQEASKANELAGSLAMEELTTAILEHSKVFATKKFEPDKYLDELVRAHQDRKKDVGNI